MPTVELTAELEPKPPKPPVDNSKFATPGGTKGGFHNPDAHNRCTAKSKRSGVRCKGIAVATSPNQKCRMHGGNAQGGVAVASFKHGRHSKYLPSNLDKLYREARSNPDLIEMADHIALLEARIQSILQASSEGDPVPKWKDMAEVFAEVETAILSGDQNRLVSQLEQFHKLLDAGIKWDRTWGEVLVTMEQLRKLTDTEVKRKKELSQMVPVERVIVLMAAVGEAVKRNVTNPLEIDAVYRELALLHGSDRVPGGISTATRVGAEAPNVIDVTPSKRRKGAPNGI